MADGGDDIPLTCISNDQLQLQINALLVYPFTLNLFFKLFGKQTHTDIFGPIVKIPVMLSESRFAKHRSVVGCWSEFRILHVFALVPSPKK